MMTPAKPTRAIGYGRVSRRAGREGVPFMSPRQQEEKVAEWCARTGVAVIDHLQEDDASGGTINRPRL